MAELVGISIESLQNRVEAIFLGVGLNETQAHGISRAIVCGERDECKSHGIYRIEGALRTIKAGKVQSDAIPHVLPRQSESSIIKVDAAGGFANPAFHLGVPELVECARLRGIAALVVNNGTHFSALWPEVEALTDHGLAALVMCPAYSAVAPAGGSRPLLGTNPFAFGWPREDGPPYVFDFATSVAARGEIELHRIAGKKLPDGWAVDVDGNPTNDPEAALSGAMLTFGGHKGSAISTMVELLAGIMIDDMTSPEVLAYLGTTKYAPIHGELILAFSPGAFNAGRLGNPFARAEKLFEAIVGQGARLPSQRRFEARERSKANGISLTASEVEQLARFEALGLEALS